MHRTIDQPIDPSSTIDMLMKVAMVADRWGVRMGKIGMEVKLNEIRMKWIRKNTNTGTTLKIMEVK